MRRLALLLLLLLAAPAQAAPRAGLTWPLAGDPVVLRGFQPPEVRWAAGHRGVDLRADPGQQVRSAGAGRVTYAGVLAGRGVVTVTHSGGLRTTYEPVAAAVRVGQQVEAGQPLGRLTSGHAPCGDCLHWGLLRGETYLDPLGLVLSQKVRLLPLEASPSGAPATLTAPTSSAGPPAAGAAVATGSLALGVALLATRRRPAPAAPPPAPVDLQAERARRRVA